MASHINTMGLPVVVPYYLELLQPKLIEVQDAAVDSCRGVNSLKGPEFGLLEVGVNPQCPEYPLS